MSRLNTFYGKKGEKGMSLLVFVTFFVIYSALGMFLQVISLEEEFAGASAAAVFLGRDWTETMPAVDSIGGFLRGIPYIPAMLCPDPVIQYKLIMLINSALYALIPLVAFRLTAKLGVEKLGKRLLVTLICGADLFALYAVRAAFRCVCLAVIACYIQRRKGKREKSKRIFCVGYGRLAYRLCLLS